MRTLKKPFLFWDSSSMADFSSRNVKVSEVYEESNRKLGIVFILSFFCQWLIGLHISRQEQEVKLHFCEAGHIKLSHCFMHRELFMWGTVAFKYIFTKQDLPLLLTNL